MTTTMPPATSRSTSSDSAERIARLSRASAKRVIDPDRDLPGSVGDGQLIPDELLTVAGLGLDLSAEQRRVLSREEIASITDAGIRFESVLNAGFSMQIVGARDLTDPRITFLLHEIGEETRHQRLFIRLLEQIRPQAVDPLDRGIARRLMRFGSRTIIKLPALLYTLVLAGEEIPDLFQKLASEHPDTDPFLKEVNRYHRQEEARHLSYARTVLPEVWAEASAVERYAVRRIAPFLIRGMFETIVHPGVYAEVGLPTWETWKAANRSPQRIALRHEATRPVLAALLAAGAIRPGRVNSRWQSLCGVDAAGQPVVAT
ncbi:MAG TPA: diiron oxygenase [Acidimicrobiales bacterium]|nr:diiron oxygenase [Acidimicrobiales bacterium]